MNGIMTSWKILPAPSEKNLLLRNSPKFLLQKDYLSELHWTDISFFFLLNWRFAEINFVLKMIRSKDFACRYFFRLNMHGCPSEIQSDNMPYVICIYWTNSEGVSDIRPCEKN